MQIRAEQLKVLSSASMTNFKIRLIQHIRECFSREHAALGDPCVRMLVDFGVANAQSHGFEERRSICGFIDMMLTFGPDFDLDPKLNWVFPILQDKTIPSEARMIKLLETANIALKSMNE